MAAAEAKEISLDSVTKVFRLGLFRKKTAVDDVSFVIPEGEIVGLLGPNGSGKSTIIKMILGLLNPTSGEISICGYKSNEKKARGLIGYLPENPRFQKFLTAREILHYYGKLLYLETGPLKSRVEELLELVCLTRAADERTQGFSKGMIQRLAVAQSLLAKPPLLIFDEPMSGLDPQGRISIREIMCQIHEQMPSTTLFFSTHVLSDAERLCHSVLLMKNGKLSRSCSIQELLLNDSERYDLVVSHMEPTLQEKYKKADDLHQTPLGLVISVNGCEALMEEMGNLRSAGVKIIGVSSRRKSLEEALFGDDNAVNMEASL